MHSKIKTFLNLHLWPFWGLADTSSKLHFDEKGNFISADPSTHGDHIVRAANRKKLKERGGILHYLIGWLALTFLFLIAGSLVLSWNKILYVLFFMLFVISSMMSIFLMLLHWAIDRKGF
jgi:hypothetical protein